MRHQIVADMVLKGLNMKLHQLNYGVFYLFVFKFIGQFSFNNIYTLGINSAEKTALHTIVKFLNMIDLDPMRNKRQDQSY